MARTANDQLDTAVDLAFTDLEWAAESSAAPPAAEPLIEVRICGADLAEIVRLLPHWRSDVASGDAILRIVERLVKSSGKAR